jgi:hypothetical protein
VQFWVDEKYRGNGAQKYCRSEKVKKRLGPRARMNQAWGSNRKEPGLKFLGWIA